MNNFIRKAKMLSRAFSLQFRDKKQKVDGGVKRLVREDIHEALDFIRKSYTG